MAMTASAQPSSHSRARLAYTVRPLMNGDTLEAVSVELRFKGSPTGTTVLDLPKEWGGKTKLYEALSDFSVSGANSRIQAGAEPWERVVHHRAGAWIRVRYVVHHADEGESDRKSTRLNSSHLVISYAVFCLKNKRRTRNVMSEDN